MKRFFNILQFIKKVYFLGLAICIVGLAGIESRSDQDGTNDHYTIPSITTYGGNKIICKDGWIPARTKQLGPTTAFVCVKLYRRPHTWLDAQNVCRADHSFLIKLESRLGLGRNSLDQVLINEGINHIWSGLHVEDSRLIWDEKKSHIVQSYVGQNEPFGDVKRGWKWQQGTFQDSSNTCGAFSAGATPLKRSVRSTNIDSDDTTTAPTNQTTLNNTTTQNTNDSQNSTTDQNQDDDSNDDQSVDVNSGNSKDSDTVTRSPNVTTTEASSVELTTEFDSIEVTDEPDSADVDDTTLGNFTFETTTQAPTVLDIHKRSTLKQQKFTTPKTPNPARNVLEADPVNSTQETADSQEILANSSQKTQQTPDAYVDDSKEVVDNVTDTVTPVPVPTASAPVKGTSVTTIATVSYTDVDDLVPDSKESNTNDNSPEVLDYITAAATEGSPQQSAESRVAPPINVAPHADLLPSLSDALDAHNSQIQNMRPRMEMEDCEKPFPFICYSEPIHSLSPDPHCGVHWVSHHHLDKCYRVIETPYTQEGAAQNCVDRGGRLADINNTFYGNISAMAFASHPRRASLGTHVWVDFAESRDDTSDSKCDAVSGYDVAKINCETRLPSVCEKQVPLTEVAETENFEDFLDTPGKVQLVHMTSMRAGTLLCPLQSSSPDELVLWYKDGVLIQDLGSVYLGQNNNEFKINNQNRFSGTLVLDLSLFRRLKSQETGLTFPSLLQGKYWCEVWRRRPFKRIKSVTYMIRYTDVVTLSGTIQTKGISAEDAALFNLMDTAVGLTRSVSEDMLFFNNNITSTIRSSKPLLNNIVTKVVKADNETGRIKFMTYLSLSREVVPEEFKSQIVQDYLKNLNAMIVDNSALLSQHWNVAHDVSKYIFIGRTDVCTEQYLKDEVTGLGAHFPTTFVNSSSLSAEVCDGKPAGTARCIGDLEERAYWHDWVVDNECGTFPDMSSEEFVETNGDEIEAIARPSLFMPIPTSNPGLVELEKVEVEDANVEDISDKMVELMSQPESLTEDDINRIAKVMDKINTVSKPAIKVSQNLVRTVDKVLDSSRNDINNAETHNKAASRILANMEEIANKAQLGKEKTIRLVTPNIAMEIWELNETDTPVIGLGAKVSQSWSNPLTEPRIMTIMDRFDKQLEDFDVAIELPENLVKDRQKAGHPTRLSMFIYRKVGLFKSNSSSLMVNSPIISASVAGQKVENLQEKVRMVFRPFKTTADRADKTKCVFWDFKLDNYQGGWSTEGCVYDGILYDKDCCMCDHLTNFAVLLDFYGHSEPIDPIHDFSLSIITLIGLSLSIFGLGMTIVTFIFFSKLRQGRAQQTLFHMALSLLGSEVLFLVGIKQTDNYYVCLTVAACLHYFILVSFMWMLVEAILQYLTFVKVLGTYISRYTLKTAIPAWGVPLIPVITVLNIDYTLYKGRDTYCWMDLDAFYWSFALPIGVIILFNIIMFIIIIISLARRPRGLRVHHSSSKNSAAKTNLKAAMTIFVLLGLTWSFGYMAIADARLVFQYIFTFLSSLQGFFIFILLVARRKQIRDQWMVICCREGTAMRLRKSLSVSNSNSNSMSSNSSSGSGASRRKLHNASTRTIDTIVNNQSFDSLYFIPTSSIPTKHVSDD
ncbi:uncharacterized protein LOC126828473 isoform X2 [Patella vulgata]|uniref:uncharacterized protein LOC126828473 isoform X2 n=1 Tax=Patella vulgata TaxID=6465 RepID=UPI00217FB512|nr:uncharacterized protein LOC126828473 isoform X2 [Patella vulgata]